MKSTSASSRWLLLSLLMAIAPGCASDTICSCPEPIDYIEHTVRSVSFEDNRIFRLTAPNAFFFVQGKEYS